MANKFEFYFFIYKTKKFFFVKEKSIHKLGKHWASGIGSFDKQHILNHRNRLES